MTHRRSGNPLWRGYEIFAMGLGLGLLVLICLISIPLFALLFVALPHRRHKTASRRLIRFGFSVYLTLLRAVCQVRLDLDGLAVLDRDEPMIVVANHPSLLDAVLLLASLPNASCVLKASLLRNPLLGVGARMAGYVSNEEPRRMITQACEELRSGAHFILFPEGTRSTDFPISPFGSACVVIAKHSRAPLQTVFLEFSTPYLGKRWGLLTPPVLPLHIRARPGRRFEPPELTAQALTDLEAYFRSELGPT